MSESPPKAKHKSGRRRPRSGVPRLWDDLRCAQANTIRRDAAQLANEYPDAPRSAVIDVAIRRLRWTEAEGDLSAARSQRDKGRGRRPSESTIRKYQKRSALEWSSYQSALASLREMTSRNGHTKRSPIELMQQWVEAEGHADA